MRKVFCVLFCILGSWGNVMPMKLYDMMCVVKTIHTTLIVMTMYVYINIHIYIYLHIYTYIYIYIHTHWSFIYPISECAFRHWLVMSWAAWLLHCSAHESSRQGWWYDWFGTSNNLGHKFKVWCLILFDPFLKSWAYDQLISDLGKIPIYPGGSLFAQLFDVICFFGRACGSVACTNPEIILQIEATFLINLDASC